MACASTRPSGNHCSPSAPFPRSLPILQRQSVSLISVHVITAPTPPESEQGKLKGRGAILIVWRHHIAGRAAHCPSIGGPHLEGGMWYSGIFRDPGTARGVLTRPHCALGTLCTYMHGSIPRPPFAMAVIGRAHNVPEVRVYMLYHIDAGIYPTNFTLRCFRCDAAVSRRPWPNRM